MRIGGKDLKNVNTFDLNNSHNEEESVDFNIKDYITKLMKTTTILNEFTIEENQYINNEEVKQNNHKIQNILTIFNVEKKKCNDEIDIETKKIDQSRHEAEKVYKSSTNKNPRYLINKKYQLYKTEICRSHSEVGYCKYGNKCQFAHNISELRNVMRHPRYKTETCRTFWEEGSCPYGKRCCFIHVPKKTNNVLNEKEVSNIIIPSATIVDKNQDRDVSDSTSTDLINEFLLIENLFVGNKNNRIEFKDMDDINIDFKEINISDFDICYDKLDKERMPAIKYEIDELYVDSLFVQDQKPFWSTNEANLWNENSLFYIKGLNRFRS